MKLFKITATAIILVAIILVIANFSSLMVAVDNNPYLVVFQVIAIWTVTVVGGGLLIAKIWFGKCLPWH